MMNTQANYSKTQPNFKEMVKKLCQAIVSSEFCGICLRTDGEFLHLEDLVYIEVFETNQTVSLKEIVEKLLSVMTNKSLASTYLCQYCQTEASELYTYILRTEQRLDSARTYLDQFEEKVTEIEKLVTESNSDLSNTVLVFNDPTGVTEDCRDTDSVDERVSCYIDIDVESSCVDCDKDCIHVQYLTQERIDTDLNCLDCDFKCWSKFFLTEHVNKEHLNRYIQCKVCQKTLNTTFGYLSHLYFAHVQEKLNNFVCDLCGQWFSTDAVLNEHMQVHEMVRSYFFCDRCEIGFCTKKEYKTHNGLHSKLKCKTCSMSFGSQAIFIAHLEAQNCTADKRKYKCNQCDYAGNTRNVLEAHINRYHLKIAPYQCEQCSKRFVDVSKLKAHSKTHDQVKKHFCHTCGALFCGASALKKHIRIHTGEKPYSCNVCDKRFVSSSVLRTHKMNIHQEKNISCPLCKGMFSAISSLRIHIKKLHWKFKEEKFDYTRVEGLTEEHYELFRDRRMLILDD